MTANPNNTLPLVNKASEKVPSLTKWVDDHRQLLEVFLDAYCIVDLANKIVDFNIGFEELVGESHKRILKAGSFCEILKTESCPGQCPALQIFTSEKVLRLDELKALTKGAQSLQLILGGVPIHDEKKQLLGALITIRNVSAESELQKKYDERKKDSITDGLTRLFNKVYTEDILNRLVKVALRDKNPLSVLLCDIDHFKKINDTHGHQAGDYVLALVAQMLKGESRETDVVGRFGGEEFIVLLHNSEKEGAKIFAERFRKRVEEAKINFAGKQIPVTVSCGMATFAEKWTPAFQTENATKEVVNRADTALYFAKANGRNQSWQYESLPNKEPKKT